MAEVAAVMEEHVGDQRWRSMGGWPRQPKEAAGSVLRRIACGGRWLSGRLDVVQRHTRAVQGGRRFGAWRNGV
jgi:hypothetical protein